MSGAPPAPGVPVALVTGGARRLGAAISAALAARGYHVVVHHRQSAPAGERLVEAIAAAGGSATLVAADLGDPAAPSALVDGIVARLGRLDLLVNNAASFVRTPVGAIAPDDVDAIFALNARAPLLAAQAAARHMPRGGHIVNLADLAAFETWGAYVAHGMSKAAIVHMTRTLARVLAPQVRVNAIAPGIVLPPDDLPADLAERLRASTPLQRHGAPEDVVRALLYLIDAPFVTGEVLVVDGGRHVRH